MVRALGLGHQPYGEPALRGEQRGVHVGDRSSTTSRRETPERRHWPSEPDVVLGQQTADLHVELGWATSTGQRGEDPAELLGQRDPRTDVLRDHPALAR